MSASDTPTTPTTPPIAAPTADHDRHFGTDHLMGDLKRRSVRAGAVTMAAQGCKFVLHTGSTMVLARLLTPADFGLIAMVSVFTGFVRLFRDLGLSMATVQRARIDQQQVSTLFWINVFASVVLTGVTAAMAPGVALFYGEPALTWITLAIGGTFVFGGLSAQHLALLRRQMRYSAIAAIQILAMAFSIAAAIAMALLGWGYWALVGLVAGEAVATAVLSWCFSGWRPGMIFNLASVRSMLAFGGNVTAARLVNHVSRNGDNLLIGYVWGAGSVGLYSKAYAILLLPLRQIKNPLGDVAKTTLSRLVGEPERYARCYYRMINTICWVNGLFVALAMVCAEPIVHFILGGQWLGAVPIFQALAISGFVQPLHTSVGWVFQTQDRTPYMLRLYAVLAIYLVAAFLIGLPFGALGVALSYSVALVVSVPFTMIYTFRQTPLTLAGLCRAVCWPFVSSLLVMAAAWGVNQAFGFTGLLQVRNAVAVAVLVLILLTLTVPALRAELKTAVATIAAGKAGKQAAR